MNPRRRQITGDWLAVGLPLALLYFATLQRDIGIIDSGELAGVSVLLGVPHPPGYPIYSLLGRVVALIAPPGAELPFLAGLSALAVILACVSFVSLLRALGRLTVGGSGLPAATGDWTARIGGLVLGTSSVAWSQAVTNEVYGLHLLFVVLLLRAGIGLLEERVARKRALVLLAYGVGLAGGNHPSIVFLGPALLFALVAWLRRVPARVRVSALGQAGLATSFGLTVLLYLPIRSSLQPLFDWGDPQTVPALLRHVAGMQYREWYFHSSERFFDNCANYLAGFPGGVGWVVLALLPWGLFVTFRRRSAVGAYLVLVALVTVVWASGYEIFDLEPYYLPADVVAIAFAFLGAADLLARWLRMGTRHRILGIGVAGVALIVPGLQVALRYPEVDRSQDHVVRFHLDTVLETVPRDAILLSAFWDAVVSPLLYVQSVEGTRTDVTVVDTELLRRSWYYPLLRRWDPGLLPPFETEVDRFLEALAPFEAQNPYDAGRLERDYRSVIEEVAHAHRPVRPTAFTTDLAPNFARGIPPVPEGLVYVLRDSPADSPELEPPDVDGLLASGLRPADRIHRVILDMWIRMMRNRVVYLERFGRQGEADRWKSELGKLMPYSSGER